MDNMVIVGAAGGIGRLLMNSFYPSYNLYVTYYRRPPPSEDYLDIKGCYRLDVRDYAKCCLTARAIYESVGPGSNIILVNAVGISINGMGHKMAEEDWCRVIDTNLTGTFNVCRAILPFMRDRGWGRIINLSSVVGSSGVAGTCAYAASKAGILGLTRTLAIENAQRGVTVNALNLGYMQTGMIDTIPDHILELIRFKIPMERFGNYANIESAIRFLIEADYVTGTAINIDGGLLCS